MFTLVIEFHIHNGRRSVNRICREVGFLLANLFVQIDDFFRNFSADRKIFNLKHSKNKKATKNTIVYFLCAEIIFFFVLKLKKIHIQSEINYSIVLSANEIAECNKLLNKDSWWNSFSSLTKTWNSPFECVSIKICHIHKLFLLILFLRLKFKRRNSHSISFLAEIFDIAF